jgi:arylsulfatase A-like enzyme
MVREAPSINELSRLVVSVLGLLGLVVCVAGGAEAKPHVPQTRPNIVVIETDDQTQASFAFMPKARALLAARGVTFDNSFVTLSTCCPSRATFLTGQYAHNHGVLGNGSPAGGYSVFRAKHASNNLAVWLQRAGYYTALIGKFLNQYGDNRDAGVPPGWSEWHAALNDTFLGGLVSNNGRIDHEPKTEAYYQTDVWSGMAQNLIKLRAPSPQPFFLWLTPHAPHTGEPRDPDDPDDLDTTRPPARYRDHFANQPLPEPPSFNVADVSDKPSVVRDRRPLTPEKIADIREAYQQTLEADLAIDDMVAAVVDTLKSTGELANTLIVFTSDNGYFFGEHRLRHDKELPYEPSIRVPLVLRGPGIPRNVHLKQMAANIDLAPTILDAAGAEPGLTMDGRSLLRLTRNPRRSWRDALVIELGPALNGQGQPPGADRRQFVAIRTPRYIYTEYLNGEKELYDLARDPDELVNKATDPTYAKIRVRLAARLSALTNCAGAACWQH